MVLLLCWYLLYLIYMIIILIFRDVPLMLTLMLVLILNILDLNRTLQSQNMSTLILLLQIYTSQTIPWYKQMCMYTMFIHLWTAVHVLQNIEIRWGCSPLPELQNALSSQAKCIGTRWAPTVVINGVITLSYTLYHLPLTKQSWISNLIPVF